MGGPFLTREGLCKTTASILGHIPHAPTCLWIWVCTASSHRVVLTESPKLEQARMTRRYSWLAMPLKMPTIFWPCNVTELSPRMSFRIIIKITSTKHGQCARCSTLYRVSHGIRSKVSVKWVLLLILFLRTKKAKVT